MWRNENRAAVIRNIVLGVLALCVLAALGYAYMIISARNNAIDAQLSEAHSAQQVQQAEEKQATLDSLQAEYDADLNTLATYLPGIVCWGDTVTGGTSGSVSYPATLQKYINAYLTDVYTFSDSIDNATSYTTVDWDSYTISIPVKNMGFGDVNAATVVARAGAAECQLAGAVTIPAECEPVYIYLQNADAESLELLAGGYNGANPVSLGGIEGTLSASASGYYTFTRSTPGSETTLDAGTVLSLSGTDVYADYIHVICVGTYDSYNSPDALVKKVQQILTRQTQNSDRYIVLGIWYTNGAWLSSDSYDTALQQAFGDRYINALKYLYTDAMSDAGLQATSSDKNAASQGAVPNSLRSAAGNGELSGTAYKLLGRLIYERMDSLGYFEEVETGLGIDVTTRRLVADNPSYFKNIIAAGDY